MNEDKRHCRIFVLNAVFAIWSFSLNKLVRYTDATSCHCHFVFNYTLQKGFAILICCIISHINYSQPDEFSGLTNIGSKESTIPSSLNTDLTWNSFDTEIRKNVIIQSAGNRYPNAGIESNIKVGILSSGVKCNRLIIKSRESAIKYAKEGSGTKIDPYLIVNRDINDNNGLTGGFIWDDPRATYFVKLQNCRVRDFDGTQVFLNTNSGVYLVLENVTLCQGKGKNSKGITVRAGNIVADRTHYAGFDLESIDLEPLAGNCKLVNNRFDESGYMPSIKPEFIIRQRHSEKLTVFNSVFARGIGEDYIYVERDSEQEIRNCLFYSPLKRAFYTRQPEARGSLYDKPTIIVNSKFIQSGEEHILGQRIGNVDISYCTFLDNGAGYRSVFFENDAHDVRVHHCLFDKKSGTNIASNEVLEASNRVYNIEFDNNYIRAGPEDGIEIVNSYGHTSVHDNVINTALQLVDIFQYPSKEPNPKSSFEIYNIYGTGFQGVSTTNVINGTIRNVEASTIDALIVFESSGNNNGLYPQFVKGFPPFVQNGEGQLFRIIGSVPTNSNYLLFSNNGKLTRWGVRTH